MTDTPRTRRRRRDAADASLASRTPGHAASAATPATPAAATEAPPAYAAFTQAAGFTQAAATLPPVVVGADAASAHAFTPTATRVGWDEPHPSLDTVHGEMRPLQRFGDVLPELEDAPSARRPLWRHPASIVSAATTLLALAALVFFLVTGFFAPSAQVTGLQVEVTDNAVRLVWSGPDVPYQVIVVDGPAGEALDVSQRVTGAEAWLPRAARIIDERSCVVVRPAEGNEEAPVSLDRGTVDGQGGAAACVADSVDE